jgi:thymidylate kinase
MIIVFEGCRNSGKTFLSSRVSSSLSIQRYKFDFVGYFSSLGLESKKSHSAHTFAIGKELMLMQLNRDGFIGDEVIIDRGFLTVLAWGISEERISKEDALHQLNILIEKELLKNVALVYIKRGVGISNERGPKDQWDECQSTNKEEEAYSFLLDHIRSRSIENFILIESINNFDEISINNTINHVENVRNIFK